MELLILFALACWGGGRYMVHSPLRIAERRQRDSQAHQVRMARLAKRQGPTIGQAVSARIAERIAHPRGGPARDAIALWWADSWGYATDRRLRRHERAEAGQLGRQRAARTVKRWIGAQWADLTGHAPDQREPVQADVTITHPTAEPGDIVDAEIVEDDPDHPHHTLDPQTAPSAQAPPAAAPGPDNPSDQNQTEQTAQPGPEAHDPDECLASVHPLHRKEFTVSAPTHTTTITSGETLDPAAARQFTSDLTEAVEQLYGATELSVTSLTGCGVTGEPIDDLTAIQEALSVVADRARSATGHFDRHLAAQDQVMSDPTLAATLQDTYLARG